LLYDQDKEGETYIQAGRQLCQKFLHYPKSK